MSIIERNEQLDSNGNLLTLTILFQHKNWEGWVKDRNAPKHKPDKDEKGPAPLYPQQHFKLEHPVTKTASEPHQEQHLRIKKMALYVKVSFPWQTFNEGNGGQLGIRY